MALLNYLQKPNYYNTSNPKNIKILYHTPSINYFLFSTKIFLKTPYAEDFSAIESLFYIILQI